MCPEGLYEREAGSPIRTLFRGEFPGGRDDPVVGWRGRTRREIVANLIRKIARLLAAIPLLYT